MNLSKSKYCNGILCNKILWLDEYKKEVTGDVDNESTLDNGTEVGKIAKGLLGDYTNIEFNEDLNKMVEETNKLLSKDNIVITEASFNYNNNFCSVDLLKKNNEEYELYEVKGSTYLKDHFKDDISYQYYVLKNCGINVKRCYNVHLNPNYVRVGELELDKLFVIEDVTDDVINKYDEVEKNIENINNYLTNKDEQKSDLSISCFKPYKCPYFDYCSSNLPKNNVFKIRGMWKTEMIDWYKKGKISFEELLNEKIDDNFKQQIDYELNNKDDHIDKYWINRFLNTLSYPIYYLDFETFQNVIPKYDYSSPYEQIPFQYSLHYRLSEDSKLEHKEFLAESGKDPRRELAERLVKDIPLDVCTLAYNMKFEKSVIKKLAEIYPDLRDHLMNIHDNIKDLMIPFKYRNYYNKAMEGSYSIKYILPALFQDDESLNYHNLDLIQNGSDAMSSFDSLDNKTKEEQEYIRERLLRYCELDTYAMVKIHDKLKEVVK